MPSYDISRSRFRLGDDHVFALSQLATGDAVPDELSLAQAELSECGLINQAGALSHLLLPLMKTVVRPVVVISLEAAGRQGKLHHGLLIGEDHVVAHQAWPGETESEYALVEPKMLVWALADMVNLQHSDSPRDARVSVVETTVATLDAGLVALETMPFTESGREDREPVRKALAAAGHLNDPELSLFTDMIGELRSSWRMTAAWQRQNGGREGAEIRGFGVWDCGPLGYWHRELPAEPVSDGQIGPESAVKLSGVDARRIWEMITELLPGDGDITRAGER
jgi:hypothetical protein